MNMRKTRLLVKHYDPIGKKYELIKPLGYVLEGSYCAYKMINASIDAPRSIYWEVTDFKNLLGRLAYEIKRASIAYKQRSILARIVYDKLMKEIEK